MHLIVGLGNPGPKYSLTRHNIGFMAIDYMCRSLEISLKSKWKSEFVKTNLSGFDVVLQKPMTFMNLSGESVIPAAQFFKIKPDKILVIQDDIDMPFGAIRFQQNRSAGGHNGIKDISEKLGTQDYMRLKIGVGRPSRGPVDAYVLSDFSNEEQTKLIDLLEDCTTAIESLLKDGMQKASNKHNRKDLAEN